MGVQNQKQEPHTKMWGKTSIHSMLGGFIVDPIEWHFRGLTKNRWRFPEMGVPLNDLFSEDFP